MGYGNSSSPCWVTYNALDILGTALEVGLRALNSEDSTNGLAISPGHFPSSTPTSFSSSGGRYTHQFGEVNFCQKEVRGFQPEVQVRLLRAEEEQEPELSPQVPTELPLLPGMWLSSFLTITRPVARVGRRRGGEFSFSSLGVPRAPGYRPLGREGGQRARRQEREPWKAHLPSGLKESAVNTFPSSWMGGRCRERIFCWEMEPIKGRFLNRRHSVGRGRGERARSHGKGSLLSRKRQGGF